MKMAKGDQVVQTNKNPYPAWQQLANQNINYPTSLVQQSPYPQMQTPMGPYSSTNFTMLNPPANINYDLINQQNLQNLVNQRQQQLGITSGTNSLPNQSAPPTQSAINPSQALLAQYFGNAYQPQVYQPQMQPVYQSYLMNSMTPQNNPQMSFNNPSNTAALYRSLYS